MSMMQVRNDERFMMKTTYELTPENAKTWAEAQLHYQAQCAEDIFGIKGFANSLIGVVDNRGLRALGGIHKGQPYVKLSAKAIKLRFDRQLSMFREYPSIANHSTIGTFDNGRIDCAVICTIIHEIAHAIDYWTHYTRKDYKGLVDSQIDLDAFLEDGRVSSKGGHGRRWKAIYAVLRAKQLNGGVVTAPVKVSETKIVAQKRSYKRNVKHLKLASIFGQKRRYFLEGDEDYRFSMLAEKSEGHRAWSTFLHDHATNKIHRMIIVDDGRQLRTVAKNMIEGAYKKMEKKLA